MLNPLLRDEVDVLKRIQARKQKFYDDKLNVAYLIARECISANLKKQTLSLTPKGLDALSFYRERGVDKADAE
jgi:hypothetical protein